jgi:hypothetical protein
MRTATFLNLRQGKENKSSNPELRLFFVPSSDLAGRQHLRRFTSLITVAINVVLLDQECAIT